MKQLITTRLLLFAVVFFTYGSKALAQNPACDSGVPYFLVDLTGQPAGVWSSPNISRDQQCCGAPNSDACISFDVILDPNSAGIQIDMVGADPAGSLFYSIGCTGSYPGGTVKCIAGVGPHRITFCKPGNNKNIYKITSIAKPTFPPDQHVRIGCVKELTTLGIVDNSATWQSIFPGAAGDYNSYLSCTNCASPNYTPAASAPPYVEYRVCGFPQASTCGYNFTVCDTVRIYNDPQLSGSISPNPATFCNIGVGSGVTVTAAGSGGLPPYTYKWRNSANVVVGTSASYFATAAGNYTVEIGDALNSATCPSYYQTVVVNVGQLPIVNAGANQTVCASDPTVNLSGTVQNATGGVWTGGLGVFNPGSTFLNTLYTPTAAEILAGSVTLTLTSSGAGGGCANSSDQITITFSPVINVTIPSASLGCNGSSTTLNANVTGGTAPLTYQWNNGSSSNSIVASQGNYTVIVTDVIGCTGTASYNLVAPTALGISFAVSDVTINGGSNGSATANVTGGTAPYSYLWSTGATTQTISGRPYGVYTVTVTDANGCVISGSVVINEPRCLGFNVNATSTNVTCYGSNNGTANSIVVGGTLPYTYSWNTSPVQTTSNASNLPAGVYTITVSDSNSCLQTANVIVTEPTVLTNVMTQSNPTSVGGTNGSATANPFGGTTPYTYSWNTGATTATISSLVAGIYTVTITDARGCTKVDSVLLIEPPCNHIVLSVVTSNVACYGGSTGSALAVLTNATPPYTITWSNGQVGATATNLAAGNYTVTILDANNCSLFRNFSITQPSQLSAGLSVNPISCNGANDGTIDLSVSGGVFPYTFVWSNTATSEDIINGKPGTYVVTVTDQNGCSVGGTTTLIQPSEIVTSYLVQKPTCIFGSDGAIDLTVSGGVLPYSYSWSTTPVQTTQDISGIQAGGYSVSLNDANGCTVGAAITISVLQPDSVIVASHTVACSSPGSGVSLVTVVPSGGNAGVYQVSFDNGLTYQTAGDYDALLPNGATYNVWVRDNTACTSLTSYSIQVLPSLTISSASFVNCFAVGTTTTNVTISVSGGDGGPYSISYDGGATYQTAGTLSFNLPVGASYSIIAKDARGCISSTTNITIPNVLNVDANITSNYNGFSVSCNGSTNGAASTTVTGGITPYSYSWNTSPVQTTATASGIGAGSYTVTVTDGNGCTRTDVVTLTEPTTIASSAAITSNYNGQNISCNGANNGTALVTPVGGTAPYSYSWNTTPIQTSATATGLGASSYTATVTDINGCTTTSTVTLTQPITLATTTSIVSNYNGQNISCNGANDGSALATVTGGTTPYAYSWLTSPIQTTATAINLGANTYTVNVTDVNGCTSSATIGLTQPSAITSSAAITSNYNGQNISCNGANDGTALVTPAGGTLPYSYNWNTSPAQTTAAVTGLGASTYTATVTDINGCSSTSTVSLTQPVALATSTSIVSNYNGQNISCNGANDGSASATVTGGTTPYAYSWSTSPAQTLATATNLGATTYTVSITDINGCTSSATISLTEPTAISSSAAITSNYNGQNISCNGLADGTASVTPAGGTSPYTYSWNTAPIQTSANVTGLAASTYTATVTDVNGCSTTSSVTLTQPVALATTTSIVSNYNGQNISCNGSNDGSALASVSGGTSPYVYSWSTSPAQTTATVIGLGASTYTVNVSDVNGCTSSATIVLTEPTALTSNAIASSDYNGFNISCNGLNDGTIDMTTTGGTSPYQFVWNNGGSTEDISTLTAGTYSATITDINGCTTTASATLIEADSVLATINVLSNYNGFGVSCFNAADGTIDINVSGGTSTYTYTWSNGSTNQDVTSLIAGSYLVTVSDANNCTDTMTTVLTQPTPLTIAIDSISNYNGFNVSCFNATDGFINLTTSGGVAPYNFLWNNNATTEDVSNIPYGGYLITVSDINNCVLLLDTTLIQPTDLIPTAAVTSSFGAYNVSCYGSTNGTADLTVTGGLLPYNYSWSTTAITEDVTGLGAGTYTVTVTDLNGCVDSTTVTVIQPDSLIATINAISDYNGFSVSCNGVTNGSIDAGVNGGMVPYSYAWSNGETTQDIQLIGAGNYSLLVTDLNGCTDTIDATLTEPDSLIATIDSISNYNGFGVSCNTSTDGNVFASVTGGTVPYTYLWSNGATTEDISGLNANSYVLNISDLNGCLANTDTTLIAPSALTNTVTSVNPGCNGLSNGSIDVTLLGGVVPYTYNWNNGATTQDLVNIPIGTYNLIYNDLNGCTDSVSVTLIEPQVLNTSYIQQDVLCFGGNNALIDMNIIGGTLPYSYSWSNGSTEQDLDSLTQGTYVVTITDAQGCSEIDTLVISQPDALGLTLDSPVLPNGHNISFYQGNDGSIDLTVTGGVLPYTYLWSTSATTEDVSNLPAGQYSVFVTDDHGCTIASMIILTEPFDLAMPTGITPNDDGRNDFFVVKGIEAYPDNVLTIYNRWGNVVYKRDTYLNQWNGTNTSGEDLPEGTYYAVLEINGRDITLNGYVEIRRK